MKVKFSVIPFALATIAMLFFRVMSIVGVDEGGNFLGMDRMALTYTTIGIALGLFVVCILINIFDRKTAPVYPVKKNFAAGALAILSGIAVLVASIAAFAESTSDSEYYMMSIISMVFSIPAAIAFGLMSKVHFTGKSTVSGVSVLFVFPALWGCTELVYEFLNATKVSISATDLTGLFCYIFITLYYFSHSMVVSRIKGRNPVKACFIYGLPAVALCFSHGVYSLMLYFREGMGYSSLCAAIQFLILGLYACCFILEMTINSYTKDQLEIVEALPEGENSEEEEKYIKTKEYDDLVFSNSASITDPKVDPSDDYYSSAKGLDDFILGFDKENADEENTAEHKKSEQAEKAEEKPQEKKSFFRNKNKNDEPAKAEPEAFETETVEQVEISDADFVEPEPIEPVAAAPAEEIAKTEEAPAPVPAETQPSAPVNAELENELKKLTQFDTIADDVDAKAPIERVKTAVDEDMEAKENARLSEIDKLLQELDQKSE